MSELVWRKEPPDVSGYWWLSLEDTVRIELIEMRKTNREPFLLCSGRKMRPYLIPDGDIPFSVLNRHFSSARWAGPIPNPIEPPGMEG